MRFPHKLSALVVVALVAGVWWIACPTAQAAPEPPGFSGGGVWIHPHAPDAQWGNEPMVIEVQVRNSSQVNHINVTGSWPGSGGWKTLCRVPVSPPDSRTYQCTFDQQTAGVPRATDFSLSFDVYGTVKDQLPRNLSPNGIHQVSWGWGCIYVPGSGGCSGW
jgi:hypothetical protein